MSFRAKSLNTLKWSSIEKIGQFAVQLIISIVLARLLDAQIYGIIGIINIFIVISSTITDAGFSQGLIRKLDCSDQDYNSIFWFNLTIGLLIYVILYFASPLIAYVFDKEELITLCRVLFIIIPISSLNIIQITKINKELKFKTIATYSIISTIISGILGIALAYQGYGVWSLIWQMISSQILMTIFFALVSDWYPKFSFSFVPIKELFPFSSMLFVSSFLNTLFNNLYTFIVAKLYSEAQLGYYTQANKFATQPTNLIENILNRMVYPLFAQLQNDKKTYLEAYRKAQTFLFSAVLPLMSLLALCSNEGIIIVLGEKWIGSVDYFRLMCVGGITLPLHPLCTSNLKVFGKSKLIFKLEVIKKVLIVALIAITFNYGVIGLVWGQVVFFWIALIMNMYYGGKQIEYKLKRQVLDLLPLFVITIISVSIALLPMLFLNNIHIIIIIKTILFIGTYTSLLFLFRLPQSLIIKSTINKLVKR